MVQIEAKPIVFHRAPEGLIRTQMALPYYLAGLSQPGNGLAGWDKANITNSQYGDTGDRVDHLRDFCSKANYRGKPLCIETNPGEFNFAGVSMVASLYDVCESIASVIPVDSCVQQMQTGILVEDETLVFNGNNGLRWLVNPNVLIRDIKKRINPIDYQDVEVGANTEQLEKVNTTEGIISAVTLAVMIVSVYVLLRSGSEMKVKDSGDE